MYKLQRCQTVSTTLDTAWDFLKNPANLNMITPEDLSFHILSDVPETMYNGLIIEYRIKIPFLGTRKWLAEIKHIREKRSFVDEQRIGPYRLWHHQHLLEPVGKSKTRMIDRVSYQLPFGLLGRLVHEFRVKKMLEEIFDYRSKRLQEIFEPNE